MVAVPVSAPAVRLQFNKIAFYKWLTGSIGAVRKPHGLLPYQTAGVNRCVADRLLALDPGQGSIGEIRVPMFNCDTICTNN